MPTYQYACTVCGHQLEAVQSFSDAALTQCPECEGRLRKVYGAVGIVFKGSGFYRTDSRSATGNGKGGTSKPAAEKTGNGSKSPAPATGSGSGNGSAPKAAGPAAKPAPVPPA